MSMTKKELKELEELRAYKAAQEEAEEESDFIGVWRVDGKNYAAQILESPGGEKFWINIFANKYWKKRKGGKGKRD